MQQIGRAHIPDRMSYAMLRASATEVSLIIKQPRRNREWDSDDLLICDSRYKLFATSLAPVQNSKACDLLPTYRDSPSVVSSGWSWNLALPPNGRVGILNFCRPYLANGHQTP